MDVLKISKTDSLGQDSRLEHHKFKKFLLIAMRIVFTLAESVFFIINDIFLRNKCFVLLPKSVFADHDAVISSCCCLKNPRATFNKQNKLLNPTLNRSSQLFFFSFCQERINPDCRAKNMLLLSAYLERNYISFFVLLIGFRFLKAFSIYVGGL